MIDSTDSCALHMWRGSTISANAMMMCLFISSGFNCKLPFDDEAETKSGAVVEIGEAVGVDAIRDRWEEAEASLQLKTDPNNACVPIETQAAGVAEVVGVERLDIIVTIFAR